MTEYVAHVSSQMVACRDHTRIAVDIIRPKLKGTKEPDADTKFGSVMIMTRYWRSFRLRFFPQPPNQAPIGPRDPLPDELIKAGFAVVVVDARGTGASEGAWKAMWTPDEVRDYADVAEWITEQPWSNGKVGATGISYEGSTAMLLASTGQSAVRAVVPRSFEYDIMADIAVPGGVMNTCFLKEWSDSLVQLDQDSCPPMFGMSGRLMVSGVRAVDGDKGRKGLHEIIENRSKQNIKDVFTSIENIKYRDDKYGDTEWTLDDLSVMSRMEQVNAHRVPTQLWASWMDGTTARSALDIYTNTRTGNVPCEIWIGAFDHEGKTGASLGHHQKEADPPQAEQWARMIHFLRHYLQSSGESAPVEPLPPSAPKPPRKPLPPPAFTPQGELLSQVHYFVMGQDRWRTTQMWPPIDTTLTTYYLSDSEAGVLETSPHGPGDDSVYITCAINTSASTGTGNRWFTQLAREVDYGDRTSAKDQYSAWWESPVYEDATELTGAVELYLRVIVTYSDVTIIAYLELVDPDGKAHYIAEGMLKPGLYSSNALERRTDDTSRTVNDVNITLLPTSVAVPKGWKVRIALAGADAGTFITSEGSFKVFIGDKSRVVIPTRPLDTLAEPEAPLPDKDDSGCIIS